MIIITSATVTSYITTIGYPSDFDFRFSAPLVVLEIGELTDDFETALISLKRKIKKGSISFFENDEFSMSKSCRFPNFPASGLLLNCHRFPKRDRV